MKARHKEIHYKSSLEGINKITVIESDETTDSVFYLKNNNKKKLIGTSQQIRFVEKKPNGSIISGIDNIQLINLLKYRLDLVNGEAIKLKQAINEYLLGHLK